MRWFQYLLCYLGFHKYIRVTVIETEAIKVTTMICQNCRKEDLSKVKKPYRRKLL